VVDRAVLDTSGEHRDGREKKTAAQGARQIEKRKGKEKKEKSM
jgi:hypothetical protein